MVATRKVTTRKPLNPRQDLFARLIVAGKLPADAWMEAYKHPTARRKTAHESGCRLANDPIVKARIAELRAMSSRKSILSLDDRLGIMAQGAQDDKASWGERARCVEVYNKTAGDHAPERSEVVVKGDAANPVVTASVTLSKAQKVAALRATRAVAVVPAAVSTPAPA